MIIKVKKCPYDNISRASWREQLLVSSVICLGIMYFSQAKVHIKYICCILVKFLNYIMEFKNFTYFIWIHSCYLPWKCNIQDWSSMTSKEQCFVKCQNVNLENSSGITSDQSISLIDQSQRGHCSRKLLASYLKLKVLFRSWWFWNNLVHWKIGKIMQPIQS